MKNKEFKQQLSALRESLKRAIESANEHWDDSPQAIAERRQQVFDKANGFEYFIGHYFPHYIRSPHKSQLHNYLFKRLPEIVQAENSCLDAIAAPRGEAKSTIVSQLFALYCLVIQIKKYELIVMDSIDQAYPMLEAIKAELEFNHRIATDFPEIAGVGRVWQSGTIVTKLDQKVQVAGSGKKLRGLRHGAFRPDLVVLDDIENDEQVRSPEQRDKLHNWLKKTVLPLGSADGKLDIIYIGTILHYDSVLNRTLSSKAWRTAHFKAILKMPDDMALWDKWENLYLSEGEAVADAFYQTNKEAMDKGAEVSWQARPILTLMKIRARDGHATFDSEYQNDPVSGDDAIFANAIQYWTELPSDLIYFGSLDPSMGKAGASRDPSAILVGGYHRESGKLYVIEAQVKKRLPDLIIEDVIRLHSQYRCQKWFVETVQFQEFLKDELVKRSAQRGNPVPAQAIKPNTDKMLRIESLQPHIANGLILLHRSQSTLISQLRHFPKADHDDGPDALEMLWKNAVSSSAPIEWEELDDSDSEFWSKWRH
ncbi:phage terminase large subunit [Phocoenobacter skyensis]|uniref:Phage terminase large subunit n=1 Tax=Phocoenobacter skyensis TaxID=97481 RepID=A0ABT9JKQ7_9PAST|nr:phage terminase large subunit [Pasteurella skyensis]MDP8079526.1 phage terminase large subunit [Pasteurella skyensis]MDP8085398.1 phage terminase large subunit [Pasteurella skyensis]